MLTQDPTKAAHFVFSGDELVTGQSARSLPNFFLDRSALALNFRYWLRSELLSGSQCAVYQAQDLLFNCDCSVKMLSPAAKDIRAVERQLRHEATVLPLLGHPNIVELYECTRDEQGILFSVMEPLEGRDLRSLLAEVSVIPVERTLEILSAVGAALQHAHDRGFVHMDLNPRSVFLHHEPSGFVPAVEVVKVLNFGLARPLLTDRRDAKRNLHLDLVFDAPDYLAPEALELSNKAVDERADQWSLAVLAYQMLSGQLPFRSTDSWSLRALIRSAADPEPLTELVPLIPFHVSAAIAKALSKDKNRRFASVTDFISALEGRPVSASRQTQPELRTDLIERCRVVSGRAAAVRSALPTEKKTLEYPDPSFPAELLAAVDREPARLPAPKLTPPWTGGVVMPRRWAAGAQLWLVVCIMMALIPALTVLHFLHPVARVRALFHHHRPLAPAPLPAEPPPPALIVVALPGPEASPVVAPPASLTPQAVATKRKPAHAHAHHGRPRAAMKPASAGLLQDALRSKSPSSAQKVLLEGLGL